ncbi:hypothetical protein VTN02DRAFT_1629 [Thermoascus thermophilus]
MKDFKSQAIDTPGVIQRVSTLFNGHPALIQGFNTFLPPGYRIECGTEDNPDAIRVTTPSGTNTLSMSRPRPSMDSAGDMGPSGGLAPPGRPEYYDQSRPGWQQPQHQQQQGGVPGSYSPGTRMMGPGMYGQHGGPNQPQDPHYEYQSQQEQQASANAAAMAHQQEQRGVSQLQSAVSAASGAGRPGMMQASPGAGQGPGMAQPINSLAGLGSGVLQGSQADLNKRGPVEFNHAISYVNKIKNRFASAPEIYKQFLEILQTYQRESKPIQDVYAQVTQLFNTAPDLLEDFKQFLPESAAQAKQQAQAARQAVEEAPVSNVRGEPGYPSAGSLQSQTPNRDVKMPPLGQFNVKDSAKENKKRRGGPGAPGTLGSTVPGPSTSVDAARMADAQANRAPGIQVGNVTKVSSFLLPFYSAFYWGWISISIAESLCGWLCSIALLSGLQHLTSSLRLFLFQYSSLSTVFDSFIPPVKAQNVVLSSSSPFCTSPTHFSIPLSPCARLPSSSRPLLPTFYL